MPKKMETQIPEGMDIAMHAGAFLSWMPVHLGKQYEKLHTHTNYTYIHIYMHGWQSL